ncbi:hypothetical protein HYH03_015134 [Edaphochlamys debaryana]|uniref:Uncharacterized protein n=1 Tax=Edaphochlamys debaryana TaxID=47281 RepID=A0A835XSL6_9CHLO|nr:hypothetical protein HYH03_015134 [Edaphochlamys debaryana]|eukprot:KAG2486170.1 hypothetical protein HYH03_015134 [Edaphochlamys debaryana]
MVHDRFWSEVTEVAVTAISAATVAASLYLMWRAPIACGSSDHDELMPVGMSTNGDGDYLSVRPLVRLARSPWVTLYDGGRCSGCGSALLEAPMLPLLAGAGPGGRPLLLLAPEAAYAAKDEVEATVTLLSLVVLLAVAASLPRTLISVPPAVAAKRRERRAQRAAPPPPPPQHVERLLW